MKPFDITFGNLDDFDFVDARIGDVFVFKVKKEGVCYFISERNGRQMATCFTPEIERKVRKENYTLTVRAVMRDRKKLIVALTMTKWICPACGTENDSNFCANCGKPNNRPWTCSKCGRPANTSNFCPDCGNPRPKVEDM